jgi:hypothetical protein
MQSKDRRVTELIEQIGRLLDAARASEQPE